MTKDFETQDVTFYDLGDGDVAIFYNSTKHRIVYSLRLEFEVDQATLLLKHLMFTLDKTSGEEIQDQPEKEAVVLRGPFVEVEDGFLLLPDGTRDRVRFAYTGTKDALEFIDDWENTVTLRRVVR